MLLNITSRLHQGDRMYMEDEIDTKNTDRYLFSGIYDGHGGNQCSKYLRDTLFSVFMQHLKHFKGDMKTALFTTVQQMQKHVIHSVCENSGSTCNIVVIDKHTRQCVILNIGDSRTIVSTNGNQCMITRDHIPTRPGEQNMIRANGGFIEQGRVNGVLAVSRAIGDRDLSQYISWKPDIYSPPLKGVNFILQSSDGLLDVIQNEEICSMVSMGLGAGMDPGLIIEYLMKHARMQSREMDNMAVVLITFDQR